MRRLLCSAYDGRPPFVLGLGARFGYALSGWESSWFLGMEAIDE